MSAYMVEDHTINGIIAFIGIVDRSRKTVFEETGHNLLDPDGCRGLANAMAALNLQSIKARYPEGWREMVGSVYTYIPADPPEPVQAYKSLCCWLYQCAEADIPDESLLWATMVRVANEMSVAIVQASKEYEDADWS